MSNKIKLSSTLKKPHYKKVDRPLKLSWLHYVGDFAGCGNIRIVMPSLLLNTYYNAKDKILFESLYTNRYNPIPSQHTTFTVFQRSATKEQLQIIKHFKHHNPNKPLIYEIDDNLFDIPEWNFASPYYKDNKDIIKEIMSLCTGMTVSTEHLKTIYTKYNKNIQVIPNHLPKFLWGDSEFNLNVDGYQKPRICYAGSYNHFATDSNDGDFDQRLIDFVSNTLDTYQWVFVGGIPLELKDNNKIEYYDWRGVYEYQHFMKSLNIDIMLAPLQKIDFNRSKSNIKALEATAIGVPLLCTNIDPYSNLPGICDTTEYMIHQIEVLAINSDKRKTMWQQQYNVVKSQLYWEDNDNLLKYANSHLHLIKMKL